MSRLLMSTALTLGFLAGIGAAAQAQSVSSLPPPSGVTPASPPPVTSSTTQPLGPKPGAGAVWQEDHYRPAPGYDADKSQHPYSTPVGPKPGAHSSGDEQHYQATDQDAMPARHPYTAPGIGPKPGGG